MSLLFPDRLFDADDTPRQEYPEPGFWVGLTVGIIGTFVVLVAVAAIVGRMGEW